MATLHNTAEKGDFAKTVLMPGDPLRAKFIAETYLQDAKLVNNVRGIQGYTGTYKGKRVSVMASGMGMPSIGIYSYELFTQYDVSSIIRVGSAGMLSDKLRIRSVVAAMSAYSNSNYGDQYGFRGNLAPCCSYDLLVKAKDAAARLGVEMPVGPVFSSDVFYDESGASKLLSNMGVLAVEMESAALYMNAARLGKKALCLCTVSDMLFDPSKTMTAEERQSGLEKMLRLALQTATAD